MITAFNVQDGETFYVAIHVRLGRESFIEKDLATIPPLVSHLNKFRLVVLTFSGHIEAIHIYNEGNIHEVLNLGSVPISDGFSLDHVIGVVLGDYVAFRSRERPKLFVYAAEPLMTTWTPSILGQMVDICWLGTQGLSIGSVEDVDYEWIALKAVFTALEPFADAQLHPFLRDDHVAAVLGPSWVTFREFRVASRAMEIARVLTR